jgi:threonine synthase
LDFKRQYKIGTVNSINWARLMAQVVYYFAGYFQATQVGGSPSPQPSPQRGEGARADASVLLPLPLGEGRGEGSALPKVSFTVPSGNFGNVCAGHVARMMGLPIDKLVVATNENDVLDEFFRTGIYRVRTSSDTHETSSPSMDISKASNFERFVFDLTGRDGAQTRALFHDQLNAKGSFDLSGNEAFKSAAKTYGFLSGKSTHTHRLATIQSVYTQFNDIIDTHTADGVKVAREHMQAGVPMIVLETALPIKFAETIEEALGQLPPRPARFEGIEALPKRVKLMPADVAKIKSYIAKNVH